MRLYIVDQANFERQNVVGDGQPMTSGDARRLIDRATELVAGMSMHSPVRQALDKWLERKLPEGSSGDFVIPPGEQVLVADLSNTPLAFFLHETAAVASV